MSKQKRRIALTALVLILASFLTVVPTYSWLTATSETVVNTFTSGAIAIRLDEAQVDSKGQADGSGERVQSNKYKYVAGAVLDQDPTVTVETGSEEAYVFVCVDCQLPETFNLDFNTDSFTKVSEQGNQTLWMYLNKVDASKSDDDIVLTPIYTTVSVPSDLTSEQARELDGYTTTIRAFAIQTEGLSAEDAIAEAIALFIPDAPVLTVPEVQ